MAAVTSELIKELRERTAASMLDTNCDPDLITYPIPGNDDAIRAIELFCKEMADAIIEGRSSNEKAEEVAEEVTEAEVAEVVAEVKEEAKAEGEAE